MRALTKSHRLLSERLVTPGTGPFVSDHHFFHAILVASHLHDGVYSPGKPSKENTLL